METLAPTGTVTDDPTAKPQALDSRNCVDPEKNEDEEHVFAVGELVWGKIKNHPWWPGKVYDPDRASKLAQESRHGPGRRLLVAYYGDNTFSWCEPSQLKPFIPEFNLLSQHATVKSKSFAAALEAALDDVAACLDSRLACPCTKFENQKSCHDRETCFPVDNFTSAELVVLVGDAARNVASVDLLEATMLRCWVMAFSRAKGWAGENYVYHQGKKIADLVDKFDLELDAESIDLMEESGEEDRGFATSMPLELPQDFAEVNSSSSKKTRSMAELIADLNTEEEIDCSEDGANKKAGDLHRVKDNKVYASNNKSEGVVAEDKRIEVDQDTGFGKRERKKSKYLSPPYTNLGSLGNLSVASKEEDSESGFRPIRKCSFKALTNEMDKNGGLSMFGMTPTWDILFEFLATAVNSLHPKGNKYAKTMVGFFESYRCAVYNNGSVFEAYNKYLKKFGSCGSCGNGEVTDKVIAVEGIMEDQSTENNKKRKTGGDGGSPKKSSGGVLSKRLKGGKGEADMLTPPAKNSPSGQVVKFQKRKLKDDEVNKGGVLNQNQGRAEHEYLTVDVQNAFDKAKSTGHVKGKSNISGKGGTSSVLTMELADFTDEELENSEILTNVKPAPQASSDVVDRPEAASSGPKREKGNASNSDDVAMHINHEDAKHSGQVVMCQDDEVKEGGVLNQSKGQVEGKSNISPKGETSAARTMGLADFTDTELENGEILTNKKPAPQASFEVVDRSEATRSDPAVDINLEDTKHSEQVVMCQKRKVKDDEVKEGCILNQNQGATEHDHPTVNVQIAFNEAKSTGKVEGKSNISPKGGTSAELKNSEIVTNAKPAPQVGSAVLDRSDATRSGPKRRKRKASSSDDVAMGINLEDTNHSSVGNSRRKRNKKNNPKVSSSAVLLLTFSPGSALPSKDQLIGVFGKYGALKESETRVNEEYCIAVVTFCATADAEKAFNDRDRNVAFKPPAVTYNLRYADMGNNSCSVLSPQSSTNPPLPYIRKNLEMMITTLAENSASLKDSASSDALKPEARENLVGEMQGLLLKVNKLLTGPSSTGPSYL